MDNEKYNFQGASLRVTNSTLNHKVYPVLFTEKGSTILSIQTSPIQEIILNDKKISIEELIEKLKTLK